MAMADATNTQPAVVGGCYCGKFKYQSNEPSYGMTYCYCTTCQSLHGAPFAAFANVSRQDLQWLKKGDGQDLVEMRLSKAATRTFCGSCHAPLTMVYNAEPDEIGVVAASINEKLSAAPVPRVKKHIYVSQKPSWYEIYDEKPQFPGPTKLLEAWLTYEGGRGD